MFNVACQLSTKTLTTTRHTKTTTIVLNYINKIQYILAAVVVATNNNYLNAWKCALILLPKAIIFTHIYTHTHTWAPINMRDALVYQQHSAVSAYGYHLSLHSASSDSSSTWLTATRTTVIINIIIFLFKYVHVCVYVSVHVNNT